MNTCSTFGLCQHTLIACLKDEVDAEKFYNELFEYLNDGIFDTDARNFYIGALDIGNVTLHPMDALRLPTNQTLSPRIDWGMNS